mgnify:CR=1 FL=1
MNSPFKPFSVGFYAGKTQIGTPYFFPRRTVKATPKLAAEAAAKKAKEDAEKAEKARKLEELKQKQLHDKAVKEFFSKTRASWGNDLVQTANTNKFHER